MDISLTERNIILAAHVLAAIMLLGPVTVATSLFPRYMLQGERQVARALHRISRGYGMATLAVPAFGLYLAARTDLLGALWIDLSLGLFIAAFLLLVGGVVPAQARLLASEDAEASVSGLRAMSGAFGLLWLVVLYLMVAKPS